MYSLYCASFDFDTGGYAVHRLDPGLYVLQSQKTQPGIIGKKIIKVIEVFYSARQRRQYTSSFEDEDRFSLQFGLIVIDAFCATDLLLKLCSKRVPLFLVYIAQRRQVAEDGESVVPFLSFWFHFLCYYYSYYLTTTDTATVITFTTTRTILCHRAFY